MSLIFSLLSPSAVLFVVLSFIVIHFLRNRKSNSLFGKIPQPSGKLPVLGHSLLLLKKGVHITESSFEAFYKYAAEFREHGLYGLQLAVQPIVHIFAANHFEKLLTSTKHINKSTGYYSLLPWLGSGLIVSGGEKWHKDRKMLTPIQSVDQQTCVVLSSCALDTICETSMGVNLQTQTSGENTFSKSFIEFSKLATKRSLNTLLNSSDLLYGLTSNGRKSNLMIKNMHEFTSKFIKKRKNDVESLNIRTNDPAKKKLMSLLDLMLDIHLSGNGFNLKDIQFQLDNFAFAGHDTVSNAIGFILICLANYRDIQKRVRAEINEVITQDSTDINSEHLSQLPYLEMVIKESLRLHPPAPFTDRHLYEDLEIDGHVIPKGTDIWHYSIKLYSTLF